MTTFTVKELSIDDLTVAVLDNYNRHQVVTKVWRVENGEKVIKDIAFTEEWDQEEKEKVITHILRKSVQEKGCVLGAYHESKLIGFACIGGVFLDVDKTYLQLIEFHISYGYRGQGLGKLLFEQCKEKAVHMGAKKLYISSHSAVETVSFYTKVGCVDAKWVDKRLQALEPCDCQLECNLV